MGSPSTRRNCRRPRTWPSETTTRTSEDVPGGLDDDDDDDDADEDCQGNARARARARANQESSAPASHSSTSLNSLCEGIAALLVVPLSVLGAAQCLHWESGCLELA